MRRENQIRRPKQVIQEDIDRSLRDAEHLRSTDVIIDAVHEYDEKDKALTGRVKDTYIAISEVPEAELFPEGAEILNIGDPYLKLDVPGVTSIDYETGEQSQFSTEKYTVYFGGVKIISDMLLNIDEYVLGLGPRASDAAAAGDNPKLVVAYEDMKKVQVDLAAFHAEFVKKITLKDRHEIFDLLNQVQKMSSYQSGVHPEIGRFCNQLMSEVQSAEYISDFFYNIYIFYNNMFLYKKEAELVHDQEDFQKIRDFIEAEIFPKLFQHSIEDFPAFSKKLESILQVLGKIRGQGNYLEDNTDIVNIFYGVLKLKNSLRDVYTYEKEIKPDLEKNAFLEGWSDAEFMRQQRLAIQEVVLPPRPQHMDFKIATFPDTPFEDQSFDRIIASWSVTAHIFPELDKNGYLEIWRECARLLRPDGKAYMWPTGFGGISTDAFLESVDAYRAEGGEIGLGFRQYSETSEHHESYIELLKSSDPDFTKKIRAGRYNRAVHLVVFPPKSRQRMERYQG